MAKPGPRRLLTPAQEDRLREVMRQRDAVPSDRELAIELGVSERYVRDRISRLRTSDKHREIVERARAAWLGGAI